MATITARGEMTNPALYGEGVMTVVVTGDGKVAEVQCEYEPLRLHVESMIRRGDGWMANGYHPFPGTMLQAFATLTNLFSRYEDVTVDGDIGTIPDAKPGVIY